METLKTILRIYLVILIIILEKIERDDLSDKINQLTEENHDLIAKYKELRGHYLE